MTEANLALMGFMPKAQPVSWTFALDQMRALMAELGNPQDKLKIIHVAGTSGKTSTSYYVAGMLQRAGKQVGLTVSPHVDSVRERVQINGDALSEAEFCSLLSEFLSLPQFAKFKPSYFGVMVAFAYWVFAKKELEYAVIEVGMGGRLDATNVVENDDKIAVITDIGLDHTEMLGGNLVSIAGEKAEIIKPHNQVFTAIVDESVAEVIKIKSAAVGARLTVVKDLTSAPASLPLFQQRNWSVAKAVLDFIKVRDKFEFSMEQAKNAAEIVVPARMETVQYKSKTIIMDGAHNAQKITALCQSLSQRYPQKMAAMISLASGKDLSLRDSLKALSGVVDYLIVTTFSVEQDVPKTAIDPKIIEKTATEAGIKSVQVISDPAEAFHSLLALPQNDLLITGSFYLLNHIRPLVKEMVND